MLFDLVGVWIILDVLKEALEALHVLARNDTPGACARADFCAAELEEYFDFVDCEE